jgi:hypothetical protein
LRQSVATTCTIEKSTVSHIWIYFNVLKGYKKEEYKRKEEGVHHMDCAKDTGPKKGEQHRNIFMFFHKDTKPSVFPCFHHVDFPFLFSLFSFQTIIPSWHGVAWGVYTMSFLHVGAFGRREKCIWHLRVIAPMVFFSFAMYREEAAGMKEARHRQKGQKRIQKKLKSIFGLETRLLTLLISNDGS